MIESIGRVLLYMSTPMQSIGFVLCTDEKYRRFLHVILLEVLAGLGSDGKCGCAWSICSANVDLGM